MLSHLLQHKDYEGLLTKKSVAEIVEFLKKETAYAEVLREVQADQIHRGRLENIFKQSLINDYTKLMHYFTGSYKKFIQFLLVRYEIDDLKILLRGVEGEKDPDKMRASFIYLGQYSKVNFEELAKSHSIRELIDSLKNTIYYEILQSSYGQYEEKRSLFPLEMSLDLAYFRMMKKVITTLPREDQRILEDIIGTQVDLMNMQWIYRAKLMYEFQPEEILNYTINIRRRISLQQLKDMCNAENLQEFQSMTAKTPYTGLFSMEKLESGLVERGFLQFVYKNLISKVHSGDLNIGIVTSYLYLKEYEVRDLITLIENIRYQNPPDIARQYLIRQ